ncbi:hypothetical protein F7725_016961 [Dissostichus mawsoni]|uniref:Uncharacterized protein n=1 Tax=Dissostichus mawsoni TaxID=36200 RepID=A0A7J5Z7C9_DISMA|nr:hypothetical protein F7725_016961 [Dissostichus mawsoni]
MPGISEHQPHFFHESFLCGIALTADVMLDGLQVHGFQDDFIVVRVVLLGWFDHEQITETAIGSHLPSLSVEEEVSSRSPPPLTLLEGEEKSSGPNAAHKHSNHIAPTGKENTSQRQIAI